jgi:hypothetical protein
MNDIRSRSETIRSTEHHLTVEHPYSFPLYKTLQMQFDGFCRQSPPELFKSEERGLVQRIDHYYLARSEPMPLDAPQAPFQPADIFIIRANENGD